MLYGLADRRLEGTELGEVVDLFVRREDAEKALSDVLRDEPDWADSIYLVEIED